MGSVLILPHFPSVAVVSVVCLSGVQIYKQADVQQRNRRLFGALMGHLGKAKERITKSVVLPPTRNERALCAGAEWEPVVSLLRLSGWVRDRDEGGILAKQNSVMAAVVDKDQGQSEKIRQRLRESRFKARRTVRT